MVNLERFLQLVHGDLAFSKQTKRLAAVRFEGKPTLSVLLGLRIVLDFVEKQLRGEFDVIDEFSVTILILLEGYHLLQCYACSCMQLVLRMAFRDLEVGKAQVLLRCLRDQCSFLVLMQRLAEVVQIFQVSSE